MGDSTSVAAARAKHLEDNPPDDALTGFEGEGEVEPQSLGGSVQTLSVEDASEDTSEDAPEGDGDDEEEGGEDDAEDDDEDDERDLDELSHSELLDIAAKYEIGGRHQMKKVDLVAEIREHQ